MTDTTFDGDGGTTNFDTDANWSNTSPKTNPTFNAIIDADCSLSTAITMQGNLTVNAGHIMDCNGKVMKCGEVLVEGGGSPGTGKLLLDGGSAVDFYCKGIKLNQYGHLSGTAGTIYCSGVAANGMAFQNTESNYRHNDGTVFIYNNGGDSNYFSINPGGNTFYNVIISGAYTLCDGIYSNVTIDNDFTIKGGNASFPNVMFNWESAGQKTLTIGGDLLLETGRLQAEQGAASSNLTLQAGGGVIAISDGATLDWKNGTTLDGGANIKLGGLMFTSGGALEANQWEDNSGVYGELYSYGDETITSSDNFKIETHCDVGCTAYFDILANKAQNTYVSGTATPTFSCDGWNSIVDPCGESTIIIDGGTGRSIYVGIDDVGAAYNLIVSGAGTHKKISSGQNCTFYVNNDFTILSGTTFSTDGPNYTDPYFINVSGTMTVSGTFNGNLNTYAPDQKFESVVVHTNGVFNATSGTTLLTNSPLMELLTNAGSFTHNSGTVILSDTAAGGWNLGGDGNFNGTNSFYNLSISGAVVNVSTNDVKVENDMVVIHNTSNPASYGYQWRAYLSDTTIGNDLIIQESSSGWPCSFGNFYSASPSSGDLTVSGNVIIGSGAILALTVSGGRNIDFYGNFINNGGDVLVF